MLYIEVAQLNKVLPLDAGEGIILERAALKDDTLVYSPSADMALDPGIREFMSEPMLNDVEGQDACKEFSGYFKGGLKAIVYEYSLLDGVVEQRIGAAECQARLDAQ